MSTTSDKIKKGVYGLVALSIYKAITIPFERYKLLLQIRKTILELKQENRLNDNDLNIDLNNFYYPKFLGYEPISVWYRGTLTGMISFIPLKAVNYAIDNKMQKSFDSIKGINITIKSIASTTVSNSVSLALFYSLDLYRIQYVIGFIDKSKGFSSRYKGFLISILGIVLYKMLNKQFCSTFQDDNASNIKQVAIGFGSTVTAGMITYPIDTIRKRQIITNESAYDAFKNLTQKHGYLSLWDGAGLNIVIGLCGAVMMFAMSNKPTQPAK